MSLDLSVTVFKDERTGFKMTRSHIEQVVQKFQMLLLTSPNERLMIPGMGVGLRRKLFKGFVGGANDPRYDGGLYDEIVADITDQVQQFMPYVTLGEILFGTHPNNPNAISITISFKVVGIVNDDFVQMSIWRNDSSGIRTTYLEGPSMEEIQNHRHGDDFENWDWEGVNDNPIGRLQD